MKKLKAFNLFIFIVAIVSVSCEKGMGLKDIKPPMPHQLVDDKTIYEVINFCLKNNGEPGYYINIVDGVLYHEFSVEDSATIRSMKKVFTEQDKKFIYKQATFAKHFRIKEGFIKGYNLISSDTLIASLQKSHDDGSQIFWTDFHKNYGRGFYNVSMPLFTENKKYALISIGVTCGALCGQGASYILEKTPLGWKIIYTYGEWVS